MTEIKPNHALFSVDKEDGLAVVTVECWIDVTITPLDTFLEHSLAAMPADMADQYADRLELFVKQLREIEQ